ncbi:MAG: SRPBCC domain-containing protein [Chloroflexi bacterium]|nr:SRPBCC domain-containing protein [Chloroflexota bacterium]
MSTTVTSEQFIKATPAQVYYALTHAAALHEWLCDFATVAPRPGGRMYLWWHGDFYSAGEYIALEENRSVKFKWFARFEPTASEVTVMLTPKDDGTLVTINHIVPDGDEWRQRAQGFKVEWDSTLPNLASVLETGLDRRTFDRPMLGINISDFSPEIARTLRVPISQGVRLDEVRQGMGAHAAGLCKDDVIVELDGKPIMNDYGSLVAALKGKKGGDKVEVVFYRGPQKKTVSMELTKRPVPDISWNPAELAEQARLKYNDTLSRLEACFKDISEVEADREPAPGEWSAKKTLAHLIHTERGWIANLDDSVGGYERLADDWGGNLPAHINATVEAYGSVRCLLDELKHLSVEMVAFLAALPNSFVERKASYFLTAAQMLELESHTISHIDQINAALVAARKS